MTKTSLTDNLDLSDRVRKSLASKLAEIIEEAGYVQKDAKNDFHGYSYASAEAVQTKFRAACIKRGVVPSRFEIEPILTEAKQCRVLGKLWLTDGESEVGPFTGIGEGTDKGDKAGMKAWTASNKYAIAAAILLSWGADPEADNSADIDGHEDQILGARSKSELKRLGEQLAGLSKNIARKDATRLRKAYESRLAELDG